jgi:hypothetical protein
VTDWAVHCETHGESSACFVCRHLSESLLTGRGNLGFVVPEKLESDEPPQAWCYECNEFMESHGGEWDTITEGFAGITMACSDCFARIERLNA